MVRITLQRFKCIGCNACVEAYPARWRISRHDGKCTLVNSAEKKSYYSVLVEDDEYQDNLRAALNCPVRIIKVEKMLHNKINRL